MKTFLTTAVSRVHDFFHRSSREIDPGFAAALTSFDMFGRGRPYDEQVESSLLSEGFGFFLLEQSAAGRSIA